jgi:hypothetical protein
MTLLFKVLNNNLDNDLLFYSVFVGVVGAMGYALARKIIRKSYIEKGVQTEAEKNFSDSPNQNLSDNVTSIDTLSPVSSTFKDTSSLIPTTSEVGIQTIPGDETPGNIEVIPNQDIVGRVVDLSNADYIAAKVEQLNALDPFLATP